MTQDQINAVANAELMDSNDETLPGVNVLLQGESGVGKTHSIGTIVDTGLEVFYVALDPGRESLAGYYRDKGKPIPENLHWATVRTVPQGFNELIDISKKINQFTFEMLTKMTDANKRKYDQHTQLLTLLSSFTDERTGKNYGAVDSWNTDRVLVIDNLSGFSDIIMNNVTGGKPVKGQNEWGVAQQQVEVFLKMLTDGCRCHFVMLAHVEKELDEVNGGMRIMSSTLGKKLAPKLPKMFSDVILAEREGTNYHWNTAATGAALKTRNLPVAAKIEANFGPIIKKWESRGGKREATTTPITEKK